MIKKISLYGLCFNFGIAFGFPTQAKLEVFLKTYETGVEIKRNVLGFPEEIALKNEDTKKAWRDFLASPKTWEADVTPCEDTNVPQTRELLQEKERVAYTNEERRICFEKYSREATPEDFALVSEYQVKGLRIIDFNSIVNGLNEVQKAKVLDLAKNEDKLFEAIDRLVEEGFPKEPIIWSRVIGLNTEGLVDRFDYLLDPKITKEAKEHLRTILKNMVHYEKPRETLALFLALFKQMYFYISETTEYYPYPWSDNIELHFYEDESKNIQALCHALNKGIHNYLGIEAYYSLSGEASSIFERDLFRLGNFPLNAGSFKVSSDLFFSLMDRYSGLGTPDQVIEIPQQKFYRAVQMSLLWCGPEELWLTIGFANVDDILYVNRMADMNLVKTPLLFREGRCDFTHPHFLKGSQFFDLSLYPFVGVFLKDMELNVKQDISSLCPTDKAWKVWLQLQRRTDVDCKAHFIRINKTQEEIEAQKLELIGNK